MTIEQRARVLLAAAIEHYTVIEDDNLRADQLRSGYKSVPIYAAEALAAIEAALASQPPVAVGMDERLREAERLSRKIQEAAERLSIEGQMVSANQEEARLRARLNDVASDLFKIMDEPQILLAALQPHVDCEGGVKSIG